MRGCSSRFASENERNSPVAPRMPAPPSSWTSSGFGSVVGWISAMRTVPPVCGGGGLGGRGRGARLRGGARVGGRGSGLGLAAAAVAAPAAGGCEEREQRDRHPDDGSATHEISPADLAGLVLVDEVVLDLVPVLADVVYSSLRIVHPGLPFQGVVHLAATSSLSQPRRAVNPRRCMFRRRPLPSCGRPFLSETMEPRVIAQAGFAVKRRFSWLTGLTAPRRAVTIGFSRGNTLLPMERDVTPGFRVDDVMARILFGRRAGRNVAGVSGARWRG